MIARQGMAIELGGVLFLFAGGLLAQQRWSLPFALYLCAWALLALVHFCVPVTAAAAPAFAASTAAPASATPTVSSTPVTAARPPPLPPCRCRSRPPSPPPCCRWSRSSPASSCCPPGSRAWASMRPAPATSCPSSRWWRWAARRCCRRWAVAPAARAVLVAALLAYAAAHGCFTVAQSPAQWPALLAGALLHGLGFGLSIPLLNHLVIEHSADGARAIIWRTCPWPSSAASACLPSWNSCPAGRRRIRRRRPDFIAVGRRLRSRWAASAPPRHD